MTSNREAYAVRRHRSVLRYFRRHSNLSDNWEYISQALSISPKRGGNISHLKGRLHCNYRWRQGRYRLLYEVIDERRLVHVFDANTRGDVYR